MKIYPEKHIEKEKTAYDHLSPLQKKTRLAAIALSFVSVFIFFVKILFF